MLETIHSYYSYWFCFLLLTLGLYGMLVKKNYVKKIIGMSIFQASIILFFIIVAFKDHGTVPVLDSHSEGVIEAATYINPLPHTLMLTAIVVGVATVGVAFSLLINIYRGYGTLEEDVLKEKMQ
jgi:multicomponent Na+:H+ antiporter subunit C